MLCLDQSLMIDAISKEFFAYSPSLSVYPVFVGTILIYDEDGLIPTSKRASSAQLAPSSSFSHRPFLFHLPQATLFPSFTMKLDFLLIGILFVNFSLIGILLVLVLKEMVFFS